MRAGPLDRRVTLQRPTEVQSASGEAQVTWADEGTVWAGRRDVRAREFLAGQQTSAEVEAIFTIRWRDDVGPKWRLLEGGKAWDITGIAQLGRRDGLELRCVAALVSP